MAIHPADSPAQANTDARSRRIWYWAGAGVILLSVPLREPLFIVAGLMMLALGGVPALWHRFCLAGVTVRRTISAARAEMGDEVVLTLTVENGKLLPVPRLEIEDEVPEEGVLVRGAALELALRPHHALLSNTLFLRAMERVTRRYHLLCVRRGVYTFGPLRLESGDPFGLLRRERRQEATQRLIVYPLVVPIERLGLPARAPFGERRAPVRLVEDPLRVAGVRDYAPGDTLRRIHWKATARLGSLQAKVYEPSSRHTLALFVDLRTSENPAWMGYDANLAELALCAAASIAAWGRDQGYAVGLYANGVLDEAQAPPVTKLAQERRADSEQETPALPRSSGRGDTHIRVAPSADIEQAGRIGEALARLVPSFAATMAEILISELRRLPPGCTLVYIGTAYGLDAAALDTLRRAQKRGHAVALLLAGDAPFSGDLPAYTIGNGQTWQRLLCTALADRDVDLHGQPPAADDVVPARARPHTPGLIVEALS